MRLCRQRICPTFSRSGVLCRERISLKATYAPMKGALATPASAFSPDALISFLFVVFVCSHAYACLCVTGRGEGGSYVSVLIIVVELPRTITQPFTP